MSIDNGPYRGEIVAFGTMHGKETAVGKAFARSLAASIIVPTGIDTDTYGTFTGEIPRAGTMFDAVRAKALLAIEVTGLPFSLGSEGSFGPHPHVPFIPGSTELLLFVDRKNDIEISESLVTHRTNFQNLVCRPGENIDAFLKSIKFPQHSVVVKPNAPAMETRPIKGIASFAGLTEAILHASCMSSDQSAQIVTDMRAHQNPTRMAVIRMLANRLARRLATRCSACGMPGFGIVDITRGLPCAWCGQPTQMPVTEIRRCAKCHFETHTKIKDTSETANPGCCQHCNP